MPRDEQSVTRGLRIDHLRSTAVIDRAGPTDLHTAFSAADPPASEALATSWGSPLFVAGYDLVDLIATFTRGTSTDGLELIAQVHGSSKLDGDLPGNEHWADLYALDVPTMTTRRWRVSIPIAPPDGNPVKVSVTTPTFGARWMRFNLWVPGGNQAGARVLLQGLRNKIST